MYNKDCVSFYKNTDYNDWSIVAEKYWCCYDHDNDDGGTSNDYPAVNDHGNNDSCNRWRW